MTAPKLVLAYPNGQTAVRAVFSTTMRQLDLSSATTPPLSTADLIAVWTIPGATIVGVLKLSDLEFELQLAGPLPLGPHTVAIASTVQSADGLTMDPDELLVTFDVVTPDFVVTDILFVSQDTFDIVFSEPLEPPTFTGYHQVITVEPRSGGRQTPVIGLLPSGNTLRVSLDAPGTLGGLYEVTLNRDLLRATATGVVLKADEVTQTIYGQGEPPQVTSLAATESSAVVTTSEVVVPKWPLLPGLYRITEGELGNIVTEGSAPSILSFPAADLPIGTNVTFSVKTTNRSLTAGTSWLSQATSVVGAGAETIVGPTTVISKVAGNPYEVVFANDSIKGIYGRRLKTTFSVTVAPSPDVYPLLAFTLLNTQVSVVLIKTADNLGTIRLYRGNLALPVEAYHEFPLANVSLEVVDATIDMGHLAVLVNGEVVAGARQRDLIDSLLVNNKVGTTSVALTFGSPLVPAAAFDIAFEQPLVVDSFLSTGFLGDTSRDLLSFAGLSASVVVEASSSAPSGGFENTGKAAFGAYAEYTTNDLVKVVIAFNKKAVGDFTGSVTLMNTQLDVMDSLALTEKFVQGETGEVVCTFNHPATMTDLCVGVVLDMMGTTFQEVVPVTSAYQPDDHDLFTQQTLSWPHKRIPDVVSGTVQFGPSVVFSSE